jgi:hypothetical protein
MRGELYRLDTQNPVDVAVYRVVGGKPASISIGSFVLINGQVAVGSGVESPSNENSATLRDVGNMWFRSDACDFPGDCEAHGTMKIPRGGGPALR